MSMNLDRDLERWLRTQLFKEREKPLKRLRLGHAAPGKKGSEVESWDLDGAIDVDQLPSKVADIVSRAQEDANGLGGVQRYVLTLHETGEVKPVGRFVFRLRSLDEDFDEISGEEGPTQQGLLGQLMRHNEANNRTMVTAIGGLVSTMVRRLDAADRLVERLMEQRVSSLQTLETALSQQHDRDMELLQVEGQEKRKDQLIEKVSLLLPAVVNKLAGDKVLNGDDPIILMMKGFADSLTPEQFKVLQQSLSTEQQIALVQVLKSVNFKPKSTNGQ